MNNLVLPTVGSSLLGILVLGVPLFLPAGTLDYWQAWVFILVFLVCAQATGIYLARNDPKLLERRKHAGPAAEPRTPQKVIMVFIIAAVPGMLVLCALDHRFGWSKVAWYVTVAGNLLVALGFLIDFVVLKKNRFAASTIATFPGQEVVTTGLYSVVRHPMYAGALVMMLGVPLALDSLWGLAFLGLVTPLLIYRILDEETLLTKGLPGYDEYTKKTRYRLVPFVW